MTCERRIQFKVRLHQRFQFFDELGQPLVSQSRRMMRPSYAGYATPGRRDAGADPHSASSVSRAGRM